MTPGNVTLGLPGNPTPPTWADPPVGPHWPADQPFSGEQLSDMTASTLQDAKITSRRRNNDLIKNYFGSMNSFWMSATAGKEGIAFNNPAPPKVPIAWGVIGPFGGGNDGSVAEYSCAPGALGVPVCTPLPVPEDHSLNQQQIADSVPVGSIDVGPAFTRGATSGFFHMGPNDRVLLGDTVSATSSDGVSGRFMKIGGVINNFSGPTAKFGAWYEKVG